MDIQFIKQKGKDMNFQDLQGLSPDQIKNAAAYMMLQSYAPIFSSFVVILISYIIRSYALSKITSKLRLEHTRLAWMPFAHAYVEGYICDYFLGADETTQFCAYV